MANLYGNLADAALGEARFAGEPARQDAPQPGRLATQVILAVALAVLGLVAALVAFDVMPRHFAAATPPLADLEDWRVWRELLSY